MAKSGTTKTSGKTGKPEPKPSWRFPEPPKPKPAPPKRIGRPPGAKGRFVKVPVAYEYHPRHDEGHFTKPLGFFKTNLHSIFQAITGLQAGLLHQSVRDELAKAIEGEYPKLRKSSLRLFMEGHLTGGRKPVTGIPTGSARHLEHVLGFLDVIETLVYLDGLKRQEEFALIQVPLNRYKYRPMRGRRSMPGAPLPEDEAKQAEIAPQDTPEPAPIEEPADEPGEDLDASEQAELEAFMQEDQGLEALLAGEEVDEESGEEGEESDEENETGVADELERENQ
jgi:hypothetical protein